jgi:hypothetical protein
VLTIKIPRVLSITPNEGDKIWVLLYYWQAGASFIYPQRLLLSFATEKG